jgi:aspartate/tyrosine/aromatic aminotransferase
MSDNINLTQDEWALLYQIMTTDGLYNKIYKSKDFKDEMKDVDTIIDKIQKYVVGGCKNV